MATFEQLWPIARYLGWRTAPTQRGFFVSPPEAWEENAWAAVYDTFTLDDREYMVPNWFKTSLSRRMKSLNQEPLTERLILAYWSAAKHFRWHLEPGIIYPPASWPEHNWCAAYTWMKLDGQEYRVPNWYVRSLNSRLIG